MYVGKNNYQNDELTFKLATGNDWWFHAKGMPGSHVIVKLKTKSRWTAPLRRPASSQATTQRAKMPTR